MRTPTTGQDDLERLYEDHILPHAESPKHGGRLETPDGVGVARNPACGDQIRIEIRLDLDGRVGQAVHESRGCIVSRAAAELLCGHLPGRTQEEAAGLTPEAMLELVKVPLTPARRRCALLPHGALHAMPFAR